MIRDWFLRNYTNQETGSVVGANESTAGRGEMGSLAMSASRVGMRRARRWGAALPLSRGPALVADLRAIRQYLSQTTRSPKRYKRR